MAGLPANSLVGILPFDFRLKREHKELEVYVMCEFPYPVILADKFAESFDGVSSRMVIGNGGHRSAWLL